MWGVHKGCMSLLIPSQFWSDISMYVGIGLQITQRFRFHFCCGWSFLKDGSFHPLQTYHSYGPCCPVIFCDIYRLHSLPTLLYLIGIRVLWVNFGTVCGAWWMASSCSGQTEVVNISLGNLLRNLVGDPWDQKLPQAEFAHSHDVSRSNNFCPFKGVHRAE